MELNNPGKKQKFSFFDSALACVIFIILNVVFLQSYYFVPTSTIHGTIVIPDTITVGQEVKNVEVIDDEAFYACTDITAVVLPSGLKSIGVNAFAGSSMTSVFLPLSVEKVAGKTGNSSPFYACRSDLVIYLEASAVPDTFDPYWNFRVDGQPLTVEYGCTWESYLEKIGKTESDLVSTSDSQVKCFVGDDGVVHAIKGKEGFSRTNKVVYMVASFLVEFVFAVAALLVAGIRKVDIVSGAGLKKKVNFKIVLLCAGLSFVCILSFSGLTEFFFEFISMFGYRSTSSDIVIDSFGMYLIYVIVSCAAPALFEELLFRGVILSGLKSYGKKVALLLSALIFMLMHGSPDQTVHQFIIGLIVGYIFYSSENLWLGAIVHFFNNFIAITQLYLVQLVAGGTIVTEDVSTVSVTTLSLLFSFISAAIGAVIGYYLARWLIVKILQEDGKINPKPVEVGAPAESTILVNGEEVSTVISIGESGSSYDIEKDAQKDFENDELFAEIQAQKSDTKENKVKTNSLASYLMMGFSIAYLVIEWFIAFVTGMM